jgi:serine/threonine protein kinase
MTESGSIKIIDFGIAEFVTEEAENRTQRRSQAGSPYYMSPEQKEDPSKVSYPSDIFSLAIIAYELYLGRAAHGIIQIALLPKGLQAILGKALQFDPKKRYADIVDFIADLSQFLLHIEEEQKTTPEALYDQLEKTQSLLLSKSVPKWTNVEIGIALKQGDLHGYYLDFFSLPSNRFGLFFARPKVKGIPALFLSSMLRGMIRIASCQFPFQPVPNFLDSLNRALCNEPVRHAFDFSLLFLDLEHNLLAFGSSQPKTLCHYPFSSQPRFLETENHPLGANPDSTFLEVKENWNIGDLLLFSSFAMDLAKIPPADLLLLDPKSLASKTLEAMANPNEEGVLVALYHL